MAPQLLVTLGTDGLTDWVRLPNGSKMSLGSISILKFVTKLAPTSRQAKQALQGFLAGQEVMVPVDETRMWELLAPRRTRWACDGPFMAPDQRTTPTPQGKGTMPTILADLQALETHIELLNKHASRVSPEKRAEGFAILVKLTDRIAKNQSDNSAYYGLGKPDVVEPTDPMPKPTPPETKEAQVEGLTYDLVTTNRGLATEIMDRAEETLAGIDRAAATNPRFKAAARAKADVRAVTQKVAGILHDTTLAEPWVAEDLKKLAARASYLHGLFVKA